MRTEILQKLHSGHLGIEKCRARARDSVWWPGISGDIAEAIKRCPICISLKTERQEPMIHPSKFPDRPWQTIGMDLFHYNNTCYLLVADYYSRFPEVKTLRSLDAKTVVNHCKTLFARHGIPEIVRSDNGPQFQKLDKSEFAKFSKEYGFTHITSSPRYPQSNGFIEVMVKTEKNILKKSQDPNLGLLDYRSTPLANGYSPAELLMVRRLRTRLPVFPKQLLPAKVDDEKVRGREELGKSKQKQDVDRRNGVRLKEEFKDGDLVWIKDLRTSGNIVEKDSIPRSYIVKTPRG